MNGSNANRNILVSHSVLLTLLLLALNFRLEAEVINYLLGNQIILP